MTDLKQAIHSGWEQFVIQENEKQGRAPKARDYLYASQFHPCTRKMLNDMLHGHELPPFGPDKLAMFRRGNDRERDIKADMTDIGRLCKPSFEVEGAQERFEVKDHQGRVAIVGKVDFYLKFAGGKKTPVETKNWSPYLTDRVRVFADLFENRWTKRGAHQMLAYLYGAEEEQGFMVLDRQGIPKILSVSLSENLERMEDFLARSEIAKDHLESSTVPEFHDDKEECTHCEHFGAFCNPPMDAGEGAQFFNDEETVQLVDQCLELKEPHDLYEKAFGKMKTKFRGIECAISGGAIIEGKWERSTKTVWPDDETKRKYQEVDPKGKFKLKVTKFNVPEKTA